MRRRLRHPRRGGAKHGGCHAAKLAMAESVPACTASVRNMRIYFCSTFWNDEDNVARRPRHRDEDEDRGGCNVLSCDIVSIIPTAHSLAL